MSKKEMVKKPFYKKWWVWVIAAIIILPMAFGGDDEEKEASGSKPASSEVKDKEEKSKEETIEITVGELYQAYEDNEIAADKKYKDKLLEVTGTISDFGVDVFGTSYIMLDTGGPFKDTQVFFKKGEDDKIAELSKGQDVTVVGTGGGLVITSLVINKSVIK